MMVNEVVFSVFLPETLFFLPPNIEISSTFFHHPILGRWSFQTYSHFSQDCLKIPLESCSMMTFFAVGFAVGLSQTLRWFHQVWVCLKMWNPMVFVGTRLVDHHFFGDTLVLNAGNFRE
jgi:hypothetical protein